MKKKWKIWALVMWLVLGCYQSAAAQTSESNEQADLLERLDRLSKEVVLLVEQDELARAKGKLEQLAELFTHIGTDRQMSIEALELASHTIVKGKQALTEIKPDKQEILFRAKQIRLLVDALSHPNQPIWKSYHKTYAEQVGEMLREAERSRKERFRKTLIENYRLYSALKPAIALNQNPSTMQLIDSIYQFVHQQAHGLETDWDATQISLRQLQEISGNVFLGIEQNTFAWYMNSNSPFAMIVMIGMILVLTLSYAAWRMRRGANYQTQ